LNQINKLYSKEQVFEFLEKYLWFYLVV
jgi:hypothetical protein